MPITCHPAPCVDPEMRNALAIERNTAAITSLTSSFQELLTKYGVIKDELDELNANIQSIIIEGFEEHCKEQLEIEKTERVEADGHLQSQCDALNIAKAAELDLEAEKIARSDGDLALQARISGMETFAARLVNAEKDERIAEDSRINERIDELSGGSGTIAERLTQETAERQTADNGLQNQINEEVNARETAVASLSTNIGEVAATLSREMSTKDLELGNRITEAEAAIQENKEDIEEVTAKADALPASIAAVDAKVQPLSERMDELNAKIVEVTDSIQSLISANTETRTMVEDLATRELGHFQALNTRIDAIEKNILEYIASH